MQGIRDLDVYNLSHGDEDLRNEGDEGLFNDDDILLRCKTLSLCTVFNLHDRCTLNHNNVPTSLLTEHNKRLGSPEHSLFADVKPLYPNRSQNVPISSFILNSPRIIAKYGLLPSSPIPTLWVSGVTNRTSNSVQLSLPSTRTFQQDDENEVLSHRSPPLQLFPYSIPQTPDQRNLSGSTQKIALGSESHTEVDKKRDFDLNNLFVNDCNEMVSTGSLFLEKSPSIIKPHIPVLQKHKIQFEHLPSPRNCSLSAQSRASSLSANISNDFFKEKENNSKNYFLPSASFLKKSPPITCRAPSSGFHEASSFLHKQPVPPKASVSVSSSSSSDSSTNEDGGDATTERRHGMVEHRLRKKQVEEDNEAHLLLETFFNKHPAANKILQTVNQSSDSAIFDPSAYSNYNYGDTQTDINDSDLMSLQVAGSNHHKSKIKGHAPANRDLLLWPPRPVRTPSEPSSTLSEQEDDYDSIDDREEIIFPLHEILAESQNCNRLIHPNHTSIQRVNSLNTRNVFSCERPILKFPILSSKDSPARLPSLRTNLHSPPRDPFTPPPPSPPSPPSPSACHWTVPINLKRPSGQPLNSDSTSRSDKRPPSSPQLLSSPIDPPSLPALPHATKSASVDAAGHPVSKAPLSNRFSPQMPQPHLLPPPPGRCATLESDASIFQDLVSPLNKTSFNTRLPDACPSLTLLHHKPLQSHALQVMFSSGHQISRTYNPMITKNLIPPVASSSEENKVPHLLSPSSSSSTSYQFKKGIPLPPPTCVASNLVLSSLRVSSPSQRAVSLSSLPPPSIMNQHDKSLTNSSYSSTSSSVRNRSFQPEILSKTTKESFERNYQRVQNSSSCSALVGDAEYIHAKKGYSQEQHVGKQAHDDDLFELQDQSQKNKILGRCYDSTQAIPEIKSPGLSLNDENAPLYYEDKQNNKSTLSKKKISQKYPSKSAFTQSISTIRSNASLNQIKPVGIISNQIKLSSTNLDAENRNLYRQCSTHSLSASLSLSKLMAAKQRKSSGTNELPRKKLGSLLSSSTSNIQEISHLNSNQAHHCPSSLRSCTTSSLSALEKKNISSTTTFSSSKSTIHSNAKSFPASQSCTEGGGCTSFASGSTNNNNNNFRKSDGLVASRVRSSVSKLTLSTDSDAPASKAGIYEACNAQSVNVKHINREITAKNGSTSFATSSKRLAKSSINVVSDRQVHANSNTNHGLKKINKPSPPVTPIPQKNISIMKLRGHHAL